MSPDEHPTVERNGLHVGRAVLWIVAGLSALYFGLFAILILDDLVFHIRWVQKSLCAVDPVLEDRVFDALRVIYWPFILAMKFMKLIPG